jgi:hypothetical protein
MKSIFNRLQEFVGAAVIVTFIGAVMSAMSGISGLPWWVTVVGAFIAAGGALWSSVDSTKSEREMREKTEEIAELTRKNAALVTGGNSFCYVTLAAVDDTTNIGGMAVVQKGEYPLYDVSVDVTDLREFQRAVDAGTLTISNMPRRTWNIGNLRSGASQIVGPWQLPDVERKGYNIFISARNGHFSEMLRLAKVDGQWQQAIRVTRTEKGVSLVIHEQVSPAFPRNEQGEIEWDSGVWSE